jgi:transposase-like protein
VSARLFTLTRFPPSQWKSIRTSSAIERLHNGFKRRIKTQTVLPRAEESTCRLSATNLGAIRFSAKSNGDEKGGRSAFSEQAKRLLRPSSEK